MDIISVVCPECEHRWWCCQYAPYGIDEQGNKKMLAHPGDCFYHFAMIKKYGKEKAKDYYGHDFWYYDPSIQKLVPRDPEKENIDELINLGDALNMGLVKCPQCGEQMVFGGGMVS